MNQLLAAVPEPPVAASASEASRWLAELSLTLARGPRGTRLVRSRHRGPLYVQKPFYPEGPELAHVYLLHPPGGLVSGDSLRIDLALGEGSQALFTTPGAGRMYGARTDRSPQAQRVALQLAPHSSAEWLPMENIVYPGACGLLHTRVELALGSRFLGWDISCTGLPASGQPFTHGELRQRFELYRDGRPLLFETLQLDMEDGAVYHGRAGLAGHSVSGVLVATPLAEEQCEQLLAGLRAIELPAGADMAATVIGDVLALRYLGDCAQQARQLFEACWRLLRPQLIGRNACRPRIWNT